MEREREGGKKVLKLALCAAEGGEEAAQDQLLFERWPKK